ncbi:hypothetical protein BpHYR1_039281, partial [Brachionus plicatilis]
FFKIYIIDLKTGADKFVSLWKSFWLKISLVGYGSTTPNEVKKPRISDSREGCFKALEQEEAKNAKRAKKGTGRGRGRPRKLVESKLTPD